MGLQRNFYSDLRPSLIAFFMRRVRDRAEAEDLAHDVFVRLATTAVQPDRDPGAYVFRVAANLLSDRARRAAVRSLYVRDRQQDDLLQVNPLDPHREAQGREDLRAVLKGLEELPPRTRQIFVLYRYEQIGRKIIAESLGISVSAVEKHIAKAMVLLTERIGGEL